MSLVPSILFALTAASSQAAGINARAEGATLYVNEQPIVTLKTGSGEFTPEKRAQAAAQAVSLAFGLKVATAVESGIGRVLIADHKILTITQEEAKAQGKSVNSMTNEVGERLQGALAEVSFAVSPRQVWMPTEGGAEISLIGPYASKVVARPETPGVVDVVKSGNKVVLKAVAAGSTNLVLTVNNEVETIPVNVLVPAARVGVVSPVAVIGRPADKATVDAAVVRAVRNALQLEADAEVSISSTPPELVPSQRALVSVHVSAKAPWRYPVESDVLVETKNTGTLEARGEELWYSNDPEVLRGPGRLYWGRLTEGKSARLLYHHQNMAGYPIKVDYSLVNTGEAPVQVAVTLGDAHPHKNPTYAGYMAGQEFFPRWVTGSATVLDVPPHSVMPIVVVGTRPTQTASGLLAIHHLSGGHVLLIGECARATLDGLPQSNVAHQTRTVSLEAVTMNLTGTAEHVYSPAEKSLGVDYEVGGRFGYVRIGQNPVNRVDSDGGLSGNFGIVYKIMANVANPTTAPADIEFVYEASAGYGGAFFRINGLVYKTPLLQPKQSHRLYRVTLQPGERKTLYLETIPLSGASYPVTLTIKPVGVG